MRRCLPRSSRLLRPLPPREELRPLFSSNSRGDCKISLARFQRLFGDYCSSRLSASVHGPVVRRWRSTRQASLASYSRKVWKMCCLILVRALEATGASRVCRGFRFLAKFPLAAGTHRGAYAISIRMGTCAPPPCWGSLAGGGGIGQALYESLTALSIMEVLALPGHHLRHCRPGSIFASTNLRKR